MELVILSRVLEFLFCNKCKMFVTPPSDLRVCRFRWVLLDLRFYIMTIFLKDSTCSSRFLLSLVVRVSAKYESTVCSGKIKQDDYKVKEWWGRRGRRWWLGSNKQSALEICFNNADLRGRQKRWDYCETAIWLAGGTPLQAFDKKLKLRLVVNSAPD